MGKENPNEIERRITELEERNKLLEEKLKEGRSLSLKRRHLFALLGGGTLLGAASQPAAAESSPWADSDGDGLLETPNHDGIDVATTNTAALSISGWNVVDMVEAGADPTGSQSVTSIVEAEAADDTLLVFPPGTYYLGSTVVLDGYDNLGLVSAGHEMQKTARFVWDGLSTSSFTRDRFFAVGDTTPVGDFVFGGFVMDTTAIGVNSSAIICSTSEKARIFAIEQDGRFDELNGWNFMSIRTSNVNAEAVVDSVVATDGADVTESEPSNESCGIGVFQDGNEGRVVIKNCLIGHWNNNGIYGRASQRGTYLVNNTCFNNGISNGRVDTHGAITGHYAYVDANYDTDLNDFTPARGIYCVGNAADADTQNVLVENCYVDMQDGPSGRDNHGIRFGQFAGSGTIRDCFVQQNVPGNGKGLMIDALDSSSAEPDTLTVDSVRIRGTTSDDGIGNFRANTVFNNCYVDVSTNGEQGLQLSGGGEVVSGGEFHSAGSGVWSSSADNIVRDLVDSQPDMDMSNSTDARLENIPDSITVSTGTRTLINGVGEEASSGPPTAANWNIGDIVADTNNSGDAYLLLQDGTWSQVST